MTGASDRLHVYADPQALAQAAAGWVVEQLEAACRERGRASLALSGGSTPAATLARLAAAPHRDWPRWPEVSLFWVDERAVGPADPAHTVGVTPRIGAYLSKESR